MSRSAGRRRAQLAELASQLARAVRAGATLTVALGEVSVGPPVDARVERVRSLVERGVPLEQALRAWAAVGGDDVALLAGAAAFGHRHGGDAAAALDGVATALADRAELEDEARALSAQARAGVAVLAALPAVGALAFTLLDPNVGTVLVGTPVGWACVALAVVLDAAGVAVGAALVRRALR